MDEASPDRPLLIGNGMEHPVHQMVADKGAGGIGNTAGKPKLADCIHHRLDRERREVGRRPIVGDASVDGLVAFVVGDPCIIDVDRHPFN